MRKIVAVMALALLASTASAGIDLKALLKDAAKNSKNPKQTEQSQASSAPQLQGTPASSHNDLATITNVLSKMYTNLDRSSVRETLVKGLYRADFGPHTAQVYVNEALTLVLQTDGNLITKWSQPVRNPSPISEDEKKELLSAMIHNIQMEKLIQFKQGNGSQRVLVISAFDCPYCIKFERMLASAGNKLDATIYLLPTTLDSSDSARVASVRNIWCASDNAATWRNGLLKASQSYPSGGERNCTLSNTDTRDIEVLLRSAGVPVKGFPFKLGDNGLGGTAAQELSQFQAQLNEGSNKSTWSPEVRAAFPPAMYAQFRAEQASDRGWYQ